MITKPINLDKLIEQFESDSLLFDDNKSFPHKNFDLIIQNQLHMATLSDEFGGNNMGFEEVGKLIFNIAQGCSSTALCLAMHLYTVAGLRNILKGKLRDEVFSDISKNENFVASFNQPNVMLRNVNDINENTTQISILKVENGYLVNGIKRSVSGAERFKYFPIYGYQKDLKNKSYNITALMIRKDDEGVFIKNNWNLSSMKSTGSNDIILENVFVPSYRLIGTEGHAIQETTELTFWSRLAISSVYLGIAKKVYEFTKQIATQKKETISDKKLAFMPGVQFKIADMKINLETALSQLLSYSRQADYESQMKIFSDDLFQKSLITKHIISKLSNEIVWDAMQIQGMSSLQHGSLLEKAYRDIRASMFHQPSEDILKEVLAKKVLGIITKNNRWA